MLPNDQNSNVVQVFAPSNQFTVTSAIVDSGTVYKPLEDCTVTYNNGASLTFLAGEVIGVPQGVNSMEVTPAVEIQFAGYASVIV